jgi:hypothetical protein
LPTAVPSNVGCRAHWDLVGSINVVECRRVAQNMQFQTYPQR